ncbi:MAG: hypothetical protein OHK93_005645 [Ramalina farinacea]|uniref:Uncharacterized protein n=1 Tax=Ramalina farinacea TaxID=258253 RepID=A0AA43QH45_9LECA|nr:hypothetical protein [Ramalina farinacea]
MAAPSPYQSSEQMKAELLNGPAAKPPSGVVPNFVDPTTLNAAVITVLGLIGFITPSIFDYQVLGGIHMWDVRLKDFFRFLYVSSQYA